MTPVKPFSSFLSESVIYKSIPIEEVKEKYIHIIKESAKIPTIYRGFKNMKEHGFIEGNVVLFDPTRFKRVSLNLTNIYTIYLSEIDPNWVKRFPPRNKSLIATFSMSNAAMYAEKHIYTLVPLNFRTPVGICPEHDIWESFNKKGFDNLSYFVDKIKKLFTFVYKILYDEKINFTKYSFTNKNELLNFFKEVDYLVTYYKHDFEEFLKINYFPSKFVKVFLSGGITAAFQWFFDPDDNEFELYPYSEIPKTYIFQENECWFSEKCLCIPTELYREICYDNI